MDTEKFFWKAISSWKPSLMILFLLQATFFNFLCMNWTNLELIWLFYNELDSNWLELDRIFDSCCDLALYKYNYWTEILLKRLKFCAVTVNHQATLIKHKADQTTLKLDL